MFRKTFASFVVFGGLLCSGLGTVARAAESGSVGSVAGTVRSNTGKPAADTTVTLVELRRGVRADADGVYRIEDVPPGAYWVQAVSARYGSAVVKVTVAPGQKVELPIVLELGVHTEHLTVTASPGSHGLSDVAQSAQVVEGAELRSRLEPTLGETLSKEAGVNSTYFGPGASRPVIRGLGGDRIRILEDGVGTGDASNVSPDHAVSSDPLAAERIEIVRGPATLLYGANAVGGVVNVVRGLIPDHRVDTPIVGEVDLATASAANERRGRLALSGGTKHFGWSAGYLERTSDDYETPQGALTNSAIESDQGGIGLSYLSDAGFIGLSYQDFNTLYGVPGDEPIQIDMRQQRVDLRGELLRATGPFHRASVRVGSTSYDHVEVEDSGDLGTRFANDYVEGRIEASHRPLGPLSGTVGLQLSTRDFAASGDEAIMPPATTDQAALFLFEEAGPEKLRVSFGARYETQDVSVEGPQSDRSFDNLSASAGIVWKVARPYAITVAVASTRRPPVAEELFTNGAHPATQQFEIGDPDLGEESALSFDLGLRKLAGRLSGSIGLFRYDFGDYIFLRPTGSVDPASGFDTFAFEQVDARFSGAEAHLDLELLHSEPHHLQLELSGDTVKAELKANDEPLPLIPPARFSVGLAYGGPAFRARVEARHVARQGETSPFETPTKGYTLVNADVGYRFFGHGLVHEVMLRAGNLGDELARVHTSPLKDMAPLPGRDVRLIYRLTF